MAALLPRRDWFRALRGPGRRRTDRRHRTYRPVTLEALDMRTLLSGVVGVSSPFPGGEYPAGSTIPIVVTFNAVENVTGKPELILNDGGVAVYSYGSGTNALTFDYIATNPQYTASLDVASSTALALNGGTIAAAGGIAATLTLPAPGAAGSLSASNDIAVMNDNDLFVHRLYQCFLNRPGSPQELIGWAQQIPSLGTGGVAYDIAHSPEALTDDVTHIYQTILGRAPDPAGLANWVQQMEGSTTTVTVVTRNGPPETIVETVPGLTIEQVDAYFLASPEFQARANAMFGTANAGYNYIEALYKVVLGRPADAGGLAAWLGALPSLGSYQVGYDFVTSAEYRTDEVSGYYQNFLSRAGSPAEVAGWVNSGLNLLSIQVAFASSPEFYNVAISI